ncbi:hypothetical protein ECG_08349 [Echinococcus granulosus]|uniref:Expressed protein n=1 Tax=Echinococcus granulosus TaxID=6210 RepID=A0A068X4M3_ECHGR|nr:hypothetical protein ECG_08349 [Echinococcus granulosus]CDS24966.1 expressed protein [Echinococcus granulosus]
MRCLLSHAIVVLLSCFCALGIGQTEAPIVFDLSFRGPTISTCPGNAADYYLDKSEITTYLIRQAFHLMALKSIFKNEFWRGNSTEAYWFVQCYDDKLPVACTVEARNLGFLFRRTEAFQFPKPYNRGYFIALLEFRVVTQYEESGIVQIVDVSKFHYALHAMSPHLRYNSRQLCANLLDGLKKAMLKVRCRLPTRSTNIS